ncbi:MAG: metallophosphoesterase family protein [bacterium]
MSNLICVFGGIYNNHQSLRALLAEGDALGVGAFYCLGDVGGFGPSPDRVFPMLRSRDDVFVMQGNYDHSIGNRLEDCACGYVDPRDNHFAQISYDYTLARTHDDNKDWLRALPTEYRHVWAGQRVLMAHGSPRKTNEFMWESACPDGFLEYILNEADADLLFVTHTGIPWIRELPSGRRVVNVGVIGRPPNDGTTLVDYVLVDTDTAAVTPRRLSYDHLALAQEMRDEALPEEFVETILTGYWTTCLEILPAKERARGTY